MSPLAMLVIGGVALYLFKGKVPATPPVPGVEEPRPPETAAEAVFVALMEIDPSGLYVEDKILAILATFSPTEWNEGLDKVLFYDTMSFGASNQYEDLGLEAYR